MSETLKLDEIRNKAIGEMTALAGDLMIETYRIKTLFDNSVKSALGRFMSFEDSAKVYSLSDRRERLMFAMYQKFWVLEQIGLGSLAQEIVNQTEHQNELLIKAIRGTK